MCQRYRNDRFTPSDTDKAMNFGYLCAAQLNSDRDASKVAAKDLLQVPIRHRPQATMPRTLAVRNRTAHCNNRVKISSCTHPANNRLPLVSVDGAVAFRRGAHVISRPSKPGRIRPVNATR